MKIGFVLPKDPLGRYRELYGALNAERSWFQGALGLRYTALTLATTEGDAYAVAAEIRKIGDRLKKRAGWFGALNSEIRFVVGAMLLRNWDDPDAFMDEVKRVQRIFRELRLPRGYIYEIVSILLIRQSLHGKPIRQEHVARLRDLYEEMKRHHWWLTGVTDYPSCAILSLQKGRPEAISSRVERFYELLRTEGRCGRGDATQLVSHILYLNRALEEKVVRRFAELRQAFREARVHIYSSDWDELAILTFLPHPVSRIVRETIRFRDAMLDLRPRCGRSIAFSLGASLAFLLLVRPSGQTDALMDAKALSDLQAIIAAQQAAAACAAASAATAASAGR